MSDDGSVRMLLIHDTTAAILIITVGVAALFALALIWSLVNRIAREDARSRRDEYNIFVFLRASEEVFNEYYNKQTQVSKDVEATP